MFYKKGVLKNFAKFIGKHLRQRLFLNKFAGLRPATLFKKRLCHSCFPVNFTKLLRAPFFIEQLWWLFLTGIVASFVNFARFPTTPFFIEYLRWLLLAVESIDCRAFRDTAEKEEMINLSLTTH